MLSKPKSRKANLDESDVRHAVKCCATQRCSYHPCYTLFSNERIRRPGGRTGLSLAITGRWKNPAAERDSARGGKG
jgi:hypothetical protein